MNDREPNSHICIVQSNRLVSQHVMDARLRFVYVSKRAAPLGGTIGLLAVVNLKL